MMNEKGAFVQDVFVADFTEYNSYNPEMPGSCAGVQIATEENGIIPSFKLTDRNRYPFMAVNFEENQQAFMRGDGTKAPQCECMFYAVREESPAWMLFLELKYCAPKNAYNNIIEGIGQLKRTCKYLLEEKQEYESARFKRYIAVSTPNCEPLDPFDADYFNQEDMLALKEETKAVLFITNQVDIHTPIHLRNGKK